MNSPSPALAWLRSKNPELAALAERAMRPATGEYHRAAVERLLWELKQRTEDRARARRTHT